MIASTFASFFEAFVPRSAGFGVIESRFRQTRSFNLTNDYLHLYTNGTIILRIYGLRALLLFLSATTKRISRGFSFLIGGFVLNAVFCAFCSTCI